METRQLHLLLKHEFPGSPVLESLTSPTSEAKIFVRGNKALVVLIDFNRGVSVTNGAGALSRYIEVIIGRSQAGIETIAWVFRDTDLQWDRFERLGHAVQFFPLGHRRSDDVLEYARGFFGLCQSEISDLLEFVANSDLSKPYGVTLH